MSGQQPFNAATVVELGENSRDKRYKKAVDVKKTTEIKKAGGLKTGFVNQDFIIGAKARKKDINAAGDAEEKNQQQM